MAIEGRVLADLVGGHGKSFLTAISATDRVD
jgi:hypothetical protein